ncbi:phosphoinositide 3-kinase regulatory subunit 4-like [Amphibalanus amphitrite]|uniref:phosphoinositide 3-kinase regulatory subunit 4-like n=1 Tax=Amphibalanus amphitrite TaxID=1232801 RepID=UPI001C929C50|nr:phosphoinositide 3-kinase regulatory subunit 4-like [Amphibalanus amphitrite]
MGNQLAGIAPSQIFPVEYYLNDVPFVEFSASLGSTRFMKVARAHSAEGSLVVKVFVLHDPTLPLEQHKKKVDELKHVLRGVPNCLPFRYTSVTERSALLVRQYIRYSLYDRMSTRPFLTEHEKRWLSFQLLTALAACHRLGVCHGDLKLENLLVTSYLWLLVADWASFKPALLPEDNPADFGYFFDTSRRRLCYVAPERFASGGQLPLADPTPGRLTPPMDVFAAGCCLAELWTEGGVPFDLPHLLLYRAGEYDPREVTSRIEDAAVRRMVEAMVQREPSARPAAAELLAAHTPAVFPPTFAGVLHPYCAELAAGALTSADEKMERLAADADRLVSQLAAANPVSLQEDITLLIGVAASCVRQLSQLATKVRALRLLLRLAGHVASDVILDRVLPYVLALSRDAYPRVRCAALETTVGLLSLVTSLPESDVHIFPEYVLPNLAALAQDRAVSVRVCYAAQLAPLAESALRLLEAAHVRATRPHLAAELNTLHDLVHQKVQLLLTDSDNAVKRTLLVRGFSRLCAFFGRHKANDLLLSHMITFLNDKVDRSLRAAFFDAVEGVVSFIGRHCVPLLTPLLLQGLNDTEEFVAVKAVDAMHGLATLGLLSKPALYELLDEVVPMVVHPSLWARQAAVGFICACAGQLRVIDVQCRLLPRLEPFLSHPVAALDSPAALLAALGPPVPRDVYDHLARASHLELLLATLSERQRLRRAGDPAWQLHLPDSGAGTTARNLFRRLVADGMTAAVEDHLLILASHLSKVHKHKRLAAEVRRPVGDTGVSVVPVDVCRGRVLHLRSDSDAEAAAAAAARLPDPPPVESDVERGEPAEPAVTAGCDPGLRALESPCQAALQRLLERQRAERLAVRLGREPRGRAGAPPSTWRPKGELVAHLHEHQGAVVRLATVADSPLVASAAADGQVRVWDVARMEGKNIANRSRQTYGWPGSGPLTALTYCQAEQALATAGDGDAVWTFSVETSTPRSHPLHYRQLSAAEGSVVELTHFGSAGGSVLVYATMFGQLVGWDLRAPGTAWRLDNKARRGLVTALCADPAHCWLVVGTSSGVHVCWDLRFQLAVSTLAHPAGSRVRRLCGHPSQPSWFVSAVSGNSEVNMWNIETGERQMTLWPSQHPALSTTLRDHHSVTALCPLGPALLTGGTDQCTRLWELGEPRASQLVTWPAQQPVPVAGTYRAQVVDGIEVVQEVCQKVRRPRDDCPRGPEPTPPGHLDTISDIVLAKASQWYAVTASRDGVVKVWK